MHAQNILVWSLGLGALGLGLWSLAFWMRTWRIRKVYSHLEQVLQAYYQDARTAANTIFGSVRQASSVDGSAGSEDEESGWWRGFADSWLATVWGQALCAQEDRDLLNRAGVDLKKGIATFALARLILAVLLPLLVLAFLPSQNFMRLLYIFLAFGIGLMLPKWVVRTMASNRSKRVEEELPLLVDLMRLLQGVGLSIDQSLHVLAQEFSSVMRVLSAELLLANNLYASGRTREQSMQRLIRLSTDDDMQTLVNLLVQVDKHGGAVQEPLRQFAQRLRDKRQASYKEKIGAITVKMTGIMVLTLLPALLVITAGPGFVALMRSFSNMNGG